MRLKVTAKRLLKFPGILQNKQGKQTLAGASLLRETGEAMDFLVINLS